MKRILSLLLLFVMLFSLVACGGSEGVVPAPTQVSETVKAAYPELCTKTVKELLDDPNYGLEMLQQVVVQTALAYFYQNPNTQYESASQAIYIGSRAGGYTRTLRMPPEQVGADLQYFNQCSGYAYDVYYNTFNTAADGSGEAFETYGGPGFWAESGSDGPNYLSKLDDPNTLVYLYNAKAKNPGNLEDALKEYRELLQPGDIMVTPGHIMMYLGDCFGDGKQYMVHCWPYLGGKNNNETGEQNLEPEGAIVVATLDTTCYKGRNPKNLPTFRLGYADGGESFAIVRPLLHEKMANHYVTFAAATRFSHPYMGVYKSAEQSTFDAVLPESDVTVTETIANSRQLEKTALSYDNKNAVDYTNITLTETIPAGTKFVSCSEGGTEKNGVITWNLNVPAGQSVSVSYTFNVGKKNIGDEIVVPSGYLDTLPTRTFTLTVGYGPMSEANLAKLSDAANAAQNGTFNDVDSANEFYRDAFGIELNLPKTMTELEDLLFDQTKIKGIQFFTLKEKSADTEAIWNMMIPMHLIGKRVIHNAEDLLDDSLNRLHEISQENYLPGDVFISVGGTYSEPEEMQVDIVLEGDSVLHYTDSGISIKSFNSTIAKLPRQGVILALRPSRTFESLSK
ncbi:MAG: hypothetical protein IJT07_00595 [Oscillospiraceae bacterium]|nr:hypothetical protein [Oscillospiraceae bacterium]